MLAEEKELATLWEMGTFMLTDAAPEHDPLPLQFVYKLKVKDGNFDNCVRVQGKTRHARRPPILP